MPKSPNIIQFSLPTEVREKLEAMGSGESVALVAKRVLLEALGDNPIAIAAPSSDALAEIQERLEKLEALSGDRPNDDLTQISYRLELLERDLDAKGDRLSALEEKQGGNLQPSDLDHLAKIVGDRLADRLIDLGDRLSALEGKDNSLEAIQQRFNVLAKNLMESNDNKGIAIGKLQDRLSALENKMSDRPLPPTLPKKEMTQGLTHKEMAEKIGSSERTMQRVAKDKERWPEGYHWSEESKKWFPA